ncbi:SRPBCC family protein [Flavobacteriaceae bacterium 14752]|uniref:SRPBCC family protein n=1 Tax=Mesohalobacter salilacus TaxID=2491711 RepID=UPI000F63FE72|nr:cell division inhibitor [Flavobacteriaceae bacterium 14752]
MKLYTINKSNILPIGLKEAWAFFSNPNNLQKLMPDDMKFEVKSELPDEIYTGQLIEYMVSPFKGFNTKWVTEITHVERLKYFVDIQLHGPYKLWHHKHFFTEVDDGVLVEDLVHYRVPFGLLGRALRPSVIQPKLDSIFEAREKNLESIFGIIKK